MNILTIKNSGEIIYSIGGDYVFREGDQLLVFGNTERFSLLPTNRSNENRLHRMYLAGQMRRGHMRAAAHLYHKAAYDALKNRLFAPWHICNLAHARRGASVRLCMRLSIFFKASEHAAERKSVF